MKKILLTIVSLFAALSMSAIPAKPGPIRHTQPDGSVITIYRHGDEWGHWTTDAQGRVVRKDADGWYRVVQGATAQTVRRQASARRQTRRAHHSFHPSPGIASGQKRFLVVLVQFPDRAFETADARAAFSNLMNESAYSSNGSYGSARDYYYDNSCGVFEPDFDVYGPVTVSQEMAYYGGNDSNGYDKHPEEAVYEACRLLDAEVDFSRYDNDNDGQVDLVFMYYAGYGEADGGDEDTIWPHQWGLSQAGVSLALDGKTVDSYACSNELVGTGSRSGRMVGIGTACHEFGHALGLPDFYDTDYDTNGIAGGLVEFSLMDAGSYNNDGYCPPYLNMMERILLGWFNEDDMLEFPSSGNYTLAPIQENKAYKTPTDQDGEYFIYECRGNEGWDAYLTAHGLLVYHVDKSARKVRTQDYGQVPASELWSDWTATNCINENGNHPCFYVVAAVDQENLAYGFRYLEEYGASYFDPDYEGLAANIPFPGAGNIKTFTAKSWNGVESDITLSGISYAGRQVAFTVSMPSTGPDYILDYYSIKNPKGGAYSKGDAFALELEAPQEGSYSALKWYYDDTEVSGTSVALSQSGHHVIEAEITLTGGKKQIVTLEIEVQ